MEYLISLLLSLKPNYSAQSYIHVTQCGPSQIQTPGCQSKKPILEFSTLKHPQSLNKDMVTDAIQSLATSGYATAYKQIGISVDWDHGHLLVDEANNSLALLFHTQEGIVIGRQLKNNEELFAHLDELYLPGNVLHGLDRSQRNHLYLFGGGLKPAKDFTWDTRPSKIGQVLWDAWQRGLTITSYMLDESKLGSQFVESGAFFFHVIDCASTTPSPTNNIIAVDIPTQGKRCLYLTFKPGLADARNLERINEFFEKMDKKFRDQK